ncbi:MAG: lysophospholipid acyltransferase family protein [Pseudomonadota bacterium]
MLLARSLLFTTFMILSVGVYALVLLCLAPLPHRYRYQVAVAWVRLNLRMLRLLCGLKYEAIGTENIPTDACVVMLKHSSAMETLVELELFPVQTWALKRELMWLPLFGWAMHLLKPIAVHRGAGRSAVNQLVQNGAQRLREGVFVMIFPEGTRVAPGETGRYGVGGAALAVRSRVPVIPVAHNAGDYWPRRSWRKYPGTVRFVIGPPIATADREPREVTADVKAWIEANTDEIRRRDQRRGYGLGLAGD